MLLRDKNTIQINKGQIFSTIKIDESITEIYGNSLLQRKDHQISGVQRYRRHNFRYLSSVGGYSTIF